ncbi:MAG: hypothetical protein AVO38_12755 [delta proteobacterium ML8_D]|nr:MAG: hypothetical protein AVO38_12755 [delta proteobacterium ML8_D]
MEDSLVKNILYNFSSLGKKMKDNRKNNSSKWIKLFNKKFYGLMPFLFFIFFASYSLAAEVHFQWGASSGVVDGYRIYYGSESGGPYLNLLDEIGGTTTEYTATLDEAWTYYLVVRAFNDYGESGNSNEVVWSFNSVDSDPPNTSGHIPGKNATGVAPNTNIIVHVIDAGDGVDRSSLVMRVNGETVAPAISGSPADYTLTYDPSVDFNYGQVITVEIDAQDLSDPPNVMDHESYNFTIVNSGSDTYTRTFGDASEANCPGTIQDTFININTTNSISSESLNTYTWPADQVANAIILKADLAAIPSGAQVQSATLYMYMTSTEDGGGDDLYDISAHKLINYNSDLSQCTGYAYDGTNSWTPNSTCYNNIPMAQSDIATAEDVKSIDKTYGYKSWNVTTMVRDWVTNPSTNYGLLLNSDSVASSGSNRFFASSEASDPSQRPKLVVTYTVGDDTTPPGDVIDFNGVSGHDQITLGWTNPADSDFAGVMIRFRNDTYPQNTTDGSPIPNGNDGKIAGSPGQSMSYVHTNLDATKSYYYSAFSYDTSNNYSQTAHAFAQPLSSDLNAPVISSFSATPSTLNNPGGTTTFSVSATDPDGDSLTYTINFGDGTASGSGSQVMHTYATSGTYTATVTVNDGNGNSVGQSLQVTVNDLPPANPKNVSAN